jgi:hypothetical protein
MMEASRGAFLHGLSSVKPHSSFQPPCKPPRL